MKTTLICPGPIAGIECLTEPAPAACLPILGESVLSYWLAHLAAKKTGAVRVIAPDRADEVRELCGSGSRWGLDIEILDELETPAKEAIVIDHLPGMAGNSLFESYAGWFKAVAQLLPEVVAGKRIRLKEIQPGVWAGHRARVSSSAKFIGPCWLGDFVEIGGNAVIGPNAFLENHVVVGESCEVRQSWLGPETFLGQLTGLHDSLAWGSRLINWKTNSHTIVPDEFLMCSLTGKKPQKRQAAAKATEREAQPALSRPWAVGMAFAQKSQS